MDALWAPVTDHADTMSERAMFIALVAAPARQRNIRQAPGFVADLTTHFRSCQHRAPGKSIQSLQASTPAARPARLKLFLALSSPVLASPLSDF
jgi:hypothetical protein